VQHLDLTNVTLPTLPPKAAAFAGALAKDRRYGAALLRSEIVAGFTRLAEYWCRSLSYCSHRWSLTLPFFMLCSRGPRLVRGVGDWTGDVPGAAISPGVRTSLRAVRRFWPAGRSGFGEKPCGLLSIFKCSFLSQRLQAVGDSQERTVSRARSQSSRTRAARHPLGGRGNMLILSKQRTRVSTAFLFVTLEAADEPAGR
jgi:hypothetical protein